MAPLPKRRHSRGRQARRQSAKKLRAVHIIKCDHCGAKTLAHHVCAQCGYYNGKPVLIKKEKKKKEKK